VQVSGLGSWCGRGIRHSVPVQTAVPVFYAQFRQLFLATGIEQGFVRNHELQWYQPDIAFCRDRILIFEARRQRLENPDYQKNHRSWNGTRRK
jgi:hypothetical protein